MNVFIKPLYLIDRPGVQQILGSIRIFGAWKRHFSHIYFLCNKAVLTVSWIVPRVGSESRRSTLYSATNIGGTKLTPGASGARQNGVAPRHQYDACRRSPENPRAAHAEWWNVLFRITRSMPPPMSRPHNVYANWAAVDISVRCPGAKVGSGRFRYIPSWGRR